LPFPESRGVSNSRYVAIDTSYLEQFFEEDQSVVDGLFKSRQVKPDIEGRPEQKNKSIS
jgi:hypothetical protein